MKLSMMIQEANAISDKLKKYYVFGRWVVFTLIDLFLLDFFDGSFSEV